VALSLPAPNNTFDIAAPDGAIFRIRHYGDETKPVRLLISHGNGFAVDAYHCFWGPLLADFDVVLFDFRNHGQNPRSDPMRHGYPQMTLDLEHLRTEITREMGEKATVGVFHSMSGRAAMKHAIEIGWCWDALFLFDPPNVPPTDHPVYPKMAAFEDLLVKFATNRRVKFADPMELAEEYKATRQHANWIEGTHELMARSVLFQETPDGDWTLKCLPALEAQIYEEAFHLNLWPHIDAFGGPTMLIGADPEMKGGPPTAFANQALHLENGYPYAAIKGAGHLLQLQQPEACREAMLGFLDENGIK